MSRRRRLLVVTLTVVYAPSAMAEVAAAQDPTLTVSRSGGGTVTSSPAGIDCGSDCSQPYPAGSTQSCEYDSETGRVVCTPVPVYQDVTLTASTPSGWSFQGWGGACSGTAGCTVTMDGDATVSASWADVQSPSVSLTAPTATAVAGTISVTAAASDNDRVSGVQFFVGSTSLGTDTTAPYAVSFNTAGHDGSRQLRAVATDPSGRTAEASRTVMVDNTDPTLSFTSGPNGQTFGPGTTQTWTFTPGDAHSGVQSVQCRLERADEPAPAYGPCSSGSYTVSDRPAGDYTLSVHVTDNVGRSVTVTRTFAIDATAPAASVTDGPADGSSTTSTSVAFAFAASEAATFQCRVYPAALTPPAFGACSDAGRHVASGFSPGTYAFEVRAIDAVGNVGPAVRRTFVVTAATAADSGGSGGSSGGSGGSSGGSGGGTPTSSSASPVVAFRPLVAHAYRSSQGRTRFSKLRIRGAPTGSTVRLTCTGRRCPLRSRRYTVTTGTLDVVGALRRRALAAGVILTIRIASPAGEVRLVRYTTRRGKAPRRTIRCATSGGRLGVCSS